MCPHVPSCPLFLQILGSWIQRNRRNGSASTASQRCHDSCSSTAPIAAATVAVAGTTTAAATAAAAASNCTIGRGEITKKKLLAMPDVFFVGSYI